MVDTAKTRAKVLEIANFLDKHKGIDTVAIYIGKLSSFTDYFVITTVRSTAHLRGILRYLKDFLEENGTPPLRNQKFMNEDTWTLIDCGDIVIHLMTGEMREFYDLENLWHSGEVFYHSSNSS
ncbi:MAG: ribosome silencing factor [Spirochaetes bacterium]|nr:MAG: ribosome silencing factor [Spirochaetota bacterium]